MIHATVSPARIRYWDDRLGVDVLHGYGWRATCGCGWKGKARRTHIDAVRDRREHRCADNAA